MAKSTDAGYCGDRPDNEEGAMAMRRGVAVLLVGAVAGMLLGASGAPADVTSHVLGIAKKAQGTARQASRVAKKAQRTASVAKKTADSAKKTLGKGADIDRGRVTIGFSSASPDTEFTVTKSCPAGMIPLGSSLQPGSQVVMVRETRLPDGYTATFKNTADGPATGYYFVDCIKSADRDPVTF